MTSISVPTATLKIATLQKVAEGGERVIYTAVAYPDLVFKLQKMPAQDRIKRGDLKAMLLRYWPGFHNHSVVQEQKAFVKACLTNPDLWERLPFAKMYGFVASDQGPLQICEKITLDGVTIGPSVKTLGKAGPLSSEDIAALTVFAQNLLQSNTPTHDVNTSNVVKGLGRDGRPRFALVDGVGDIQAVPIRTLSAKVRRARLQRGLERFQKVGLAFDPRSFAFRQM